MRRSSRTGGAAIDPDFTPVSPWILVVSQSQSRGLDPTLTLSRDCLLVEIGMVRAEIDGFVACRNLSHLPTSRIS